MEARATPADDVETDLGAALTRIETAVASGDTDLRNLGFWRVVGRVKRDPVLILAFADRIGRVDTIAFRAGVRLRVAVWLGNLLMGLLLAAGVAAIVVAGRTEGTTAGIALLAAGIAWSVGVHSPTHWFVGWLAGIRFTDYFLGGPFPPRPGIKTDYATYLRAEPSMRAWFHASGALATKLAPFLAVAIAPATNAPGWAVALMAAYGVLQIVSDVAFSRTSSDWKRFSRERAVAKASRRR